jgi:hypothetical protein
MGALQGTVCRSGHVEVVVLCVGVSEKKTFYYKRLVRARKRLGRRSQSKYSPERS